MPYHDYANMLDADRTSALADDGFVLHQGGRRPIGPGEYVDFVIGAWPYSYVLLNERASSRPWNSVEQNRFSGVNAWRMAVPNDILTSGPRSIEPAATGNGYHYASTTTVSSQAVNPLVSPRGWRSVAPRDLLGIPVLDETDQAEVQPRIPSPRAFDCPTTRNQCQRDDCSVMHCMAQHELRMATPPKRPARAMPPNRTQGRWYSTNTNVFAEQPDGPVWHVADCAPDISSVPEDQRRVNAARIAMLPRLEAFVRDMHDHYNIGNGSGSTDPSGHVVRNAHAWQSEIREIIRILNAPFRTEED